MKPSLFQTNQMRMPRGSMLDLFSFGCGWLAAILIAVTPIIVAADFGGFLWWTQGVAGLALQVAVCFAIPVALSRMCDQKIRSLVLLVPLTLWACYAWMHVLPLDPSTVQWFSGGAFRASSVFAQPFVGDPESAQSIPMSIAIDYSMHALAMILLLIGLSWSVMIVFTTRNRIGMLLGTIALGAAGHSAFGLYATVFPQTEVFGIDSGPTSFGCFVNRNNAALLLNLGVASGLGLLAWRLLALTGQEVDDPSFELNDLIALVGDRDSAIGLVSVVFCFSGLLVCGSRGALVAAVGGALLVFGWLRQRRGLKTVPVILAAALLCAALLLVPLNLDLESVKRFSNASEADFAAMTLGGRLDHWRDGWNTALAYFPVGSGLGTYAYAYLPYQLHSSISWYHHADNLWLELFVEQGIVGIILVGAIFAIWVWSLSRLSDSADPIDQGLRVTGWYTIGVIVLSQLFDFGLIVPANLFLVTILVAAIVARGMNAGSAGAISFPTRTSRFKWAAVSLAVCLISGIGTRWLVRDAKCQSLSRRVEVMLPSVGADLDLLADLEAQVSEQVEETPNVLLYDVLAKIQHRRARLLDTLELEPRSMEEAVAAYQSTSVLTRRLRKTGEESGSETSPAFQSYRDALTSSEQSLRRLPLGLEARLWQVYLDFVHQDKTRTREGLTQLKQYYRNNGPMLLRLGRFAADSLEKDLAIGFWTSALKAKPDLAGDLSAVLQEQSLVSLSEIVTDDATLNRIVGKILDQQTELEYDLANRTLQNLDCLSCSSNQEKALCLRLAGNLAFKTGQYERAFDYYDSAIKFAPTDATLRVLQIDRLRSQDKRQEALDAARLARSALPDDLRFDEIIREMAEAAIARSELTEESETDSP